jgi:transposase
LGRSKGGFGTKFHLVTDGKGTPLSFELTAGQVHESTRLESVVATFIASRNKRSRKKPRKLTADKAYSVQRIRDWLKQQRIDPVIPHKNNETARWDPTVPFDKQAYRRRAVIEQCVGWLKECRRIGTRFEKLAVHFHGMLQLAMIRRYLKLLFSDRA